jgi:hypothetical protein
MERLTQQELEKLQELQQRGQTLINELGQIEIAKLSLQNRRENSEQLLSQLQIDEQVYTKELTNKYGRVSIDPQTGEITKIED